MVIRLLKSKEPEPFEPSEERVRELKELERLLGIKIKNRALLNEALCHRSYTEEQGLPSNRGSEWLAFLGDALVGFIVNEFLLHRYPDADEGKLTRMRSALVSKNVLSRAAERLALDRYVLLGKGMQGKQTPSILATIFEAVMAAIYLDRGLDTVRELVTTAIEPALHELEKVKEWPDAKSELQMWAQRHIRRLPEYRLVEELGPPHDRTFVVEVWIERRRRGRGVGKSRKEAEQRAARMALKALQREPIKPLRPRQRGEELGEREG